MDRAQDNITSWFVRRSLSASVSATASNKGDEPGGARAGRHNDGQGATSPPKDAGKQGKQHPEALHKAEQKHDASRRPQTQQQQPQQQQPSRAPAKQQGGEERRQHPLGLVAAATAVADKAKEAVKTAAAAADAEEERLKQQQQQQQQLQQQHGHSRTGDAALAAPAGTGSDASSKARDAPEHGGHEHHKAAGGHAPAAQRAEQQQQQPQHARQADAAAAEDEDEEAEDRPRVVAYSDSDSDVESHIQRVKHHLLPSKEEEEAAAAAAAAAEAAAQAEAAAAAAAAQVLRRAPLRRLGRAAAGAAGAAGSTAAQNLTPGLAARAGGLLLLGRVAPGAAAAIGGLGVAAPVVAAAANRLGVDLATVLPSPLMTAGCELGRFGKAAAAITATRLLHAALQRQRRRQQRRRNQRAAQAAAEDAAVGREEQQLGQTEGSAAPPAVRLLRHKSSVNLAALGAYLDLGAAIERRQPQTAAEWAQVYCAELAEMRRMLRENNVELPPDRFDGTNAELMRFCKACGLLAAKTTEQRAVAVEAGFSRVVHTAEWAGRQRFLSDRELRRWDRLVAWKAHDSSGRPILLARLGRAQQLVKPERYEEFASALLTLVHRGLTGQLSNNAGPAEQMVVVLDCRGGSSMGLTRHMGLLKRLAVTLNQHYPDRLFRLHLLELPLLLRWALHAVMPLLHPDTRGKLVLSSISDPDLAVTVAFLTKRRSSAAKPSLRRTLSNCSFISSGGSTPAPLSPQTSALAEAPAAPAVASGLVRPAQASRLGEQQGPAAVAGAPLDAPLRGASQLGGAEQAPADDDVPHTPPPTLKAPQSPRETTRARRQLQPRDARGQAHQHPHHPAHHQPMHHNRPAAPHPHHPSQHAQHTHSACPAGNPADSQQQQAVSAGVLEGMPAAVAFEQGTSMQRRLPASPFDTDQPCPVEQRGSGIAAKQRGACAALAAAAAPTAAAAAGQPAPTRAASAASDPSSHAVPWSPGMHAPAGNLSRDSSFGDELVPAAHAKAAADAVRVHEQERAAAAVSGQPAQPHALLCTLSGAASSTTTLTTTAVGNGRASSGALTALAGTLATLLPSWRGATAPGAAPPAAPISQPQLRRTSSSASFGSAASCGTPRPLLSARRRGGLPDLPERPAGRAAPGRGRTPRKSSLRRSVSVDSMGPGTTRPLGSHPLRRQSSVSWAEELETVKEIGLESSPACAAAQWQHGSPLRARLSASTQQHRLLTTMVLLLMLAVLAHRLGLSAFM